MKSDDDPITIRKRFIEEDFKESDVWHHDLEIIRKSEEEDPDIIKTAARSVLNRE